MMNDQVIKPLFIALRVLLLFTFLTGFVYPMLVTGLAQLLFPWSANGSLIEKQGVTVGSLWIGQWFDSPYYFEGRPSATQPFPYHATASQGSNLGPTNPKLLSLVHERAMRLKQNNCCDMRIPIDLVTASASGLDPEISPFAAFYQVNRVAKARNLPVADVHALVQAHITGRTGGILGEPRVNVLLLNLALDMRTSSDAKRT